MLITVGGSGIGQGFARASLTTTRGSRWSAGVSRSPTKRWRATYTVVGLFGAQDAFVNNAAKYIAKPFVEMTADDWDALRRTNIDAFVTITRKALPELEGRRAIWSPSVRSPACAATGASRATTRPRRW